MVLIDFSWFLMVFNVNGPRSEKTAPVLRRTGPVLKKTAPVLKKTAPVLRETGPVLMVSNRFSWFLMGSVALLLFFLILSWFDYSFTMVCIDFAALFFKVSNGL